MTEIIGELTAGTAAGKVSSNKCATCSATGQKLTPAGHCWDPQACTKRREARVSTTQHLRKPCLVRFYRLGATYYVREFGPKIAPAPKDLPENFTLDDYSDKGRRYYEAVIEPGSASTFSVHDALALAKMFNGTAVNK